MIARPTGWMLFVGVALSFGCRTTSAAPVRLTESTMIDSAARALMAREHVEGLALAVIDAGQVRHVASYGVRSAARDPLTRTR